MSEEDVLFRTGVTNRTGELTKAGAVALGMYPQQFLPNYSVKVSVRKKNTFAAGVRAVNANSIDGPIPLLLEETIKWVENNTDEITIDLPNGRVRTVKEYPSLAVRELVSNALIHRDMNPVSMFQSITLTIEEDRLVISNPGGLYGLSVRELGRSGSKTRNARLAEICQYIQADNGLNVVEKLGSGIPKVIEELSASNMLSPQFVDGGIYFTAIMKSGKYHQSGYRENKGKSTANEDKVSSALSVGSLSKRELQRNTGLTDAQIRFILEKMIKSGHIQKLGEGTSPNTKYALVAES
jgi:ATP-dependent DNA helicase RecG